MLRVKPAAITATPTPAAEPSKNEYWLTGSSSEVRIASAQKVGSAPRFRSATREISHSKIGIGKSRKTTSEMMAPPVKMRIEGATPTN